MHIDSVITGCRGVCLPFTDECRPLGDPETLKIIWKTILRNLKRTGWKHVELRGDSTLCLSKPSVATFKVHTINLNTNVLSLQNHLRNSTRRNINKAEKINVQIKHSQSFKALRAFYKLHCITRQRIGLPPQPFKFFENIFKYIILNDKGYILSAVYGGSIIAAAVFFKFNGAVLYKYGASNFAFQKTRANNLVLWKAIKRSMDQGFALFDFGRTDPSDKGLLQFKRGWGTDEKDINYYIYQRNKKCFVEKKAILRSNYSIFTKMPIPLLRLTGQILYKHLG